MTPSRRGLYRATFAGLTALSASRVMGANERIRLGLIGLGNRGDQVLSAFLEHPDCQVVALCDLWEPYRQYAASRVGGDPLSVKDYRRLLDQQDVDAVVICTPDHWHALQTIHACQAGKDVYVEKPLSVSVVEGRRMIQHAEKHGRVVQVGIQRLSSALGKEVSSLIQSGELGKITAVRAFHIQNEWPHGIGRPEDGTPPDGFDWDAWQGPAPERPYNVNRTFYRFRWFDDYSGGQLTNFGVHYLASIHWALGVEAPLSVTAIGGKFADYDNREIPDTLEVLWHYPGDVLVSFTQFNSSAAPASARPCEIEFRGTKGTLYLDLNGYEVAPESIIPREFPARTPLNRSLERGYHVGASPQIEPRKVRGRIRDADHARDFLDRVRDRRTPSCPLEFAHRATSAALIGRIALRCRALLDWDAASEEFTNHEEANRHLMVAYRPPYQLPPV
ncbi:MAG: NADH-dependent dehydrogenase [Isosphaeraceae bacterium]|jgi:predicted dehydrogenase|nr:MAG: NADH-dependent dehydrogenase [Isosphaeraceae bacterium]